MPGSLNDSFEIFNSIGYSSDRKNTSLVERQPFVSLYPYPHLIYGAPLYESLCRTHLEEERNPPNASPPCVLPLPVEVNTEDALLKGSRRE